MRTKLKDGRTCVVPCCTMFVACCTNASLLRIYADVCCCKKLRVLQVQEADLQAGGESLEAALLLADKTLYTEAEEAARRREAEDAAAAAARRAGGGEGVGVVISTPPTKTPPPLPDKRGGLFGGMSLLGGGPKRRLPSCLPPPPSHHPLPRRLRQVKRPRTGFPCRQTHSRRLATRWRSLADSLPAPPSTLSSASS